MSVTTLRRWGANGKLTAEHTAGGHRRYDLTKLRLADLERQKQVLELYCAKHGWTFEVIADLGSGMNYNKKGLKRLLDEIIEGRVGRLVVAHKDRALVRNWCLRFARRKT